MHAQESSGHTRDVPSSTSTGQKRNESTPSTSRSVTTTNNKRQKTSKTEEPNKSCKSPGCGKIFVFRKDLTRHERIHMNVKPFSCTWPDCRYAATTKSDVVKHVRATHFKLPNKKEQERLNIVDNRNPEDYVRVDAKLLERRLE